MTVHTICDNCGMEYEWAGVTVGNLVYCCTGCAAGGPCTCSVRTADPVVVTDSPVVVRRDDVVIVE
jgi:hypothetical protein